MSRPSYKFSGHETFALKFEWLYKAYDVSCTQRLSSSDNDFNDLIVKFGVGKNMLNSIRYWTKLSGLFESDSKDVFKPNWKGQKVFTELDPYLEKYATAWFIHWHIVFNGDAFTPYWIFSENNTTIFDAEQISREIRNIQVSQEQGGGNKRSDETFKRDVDTYLRCYCPRENKNNENSDHILSDLALISHAIDGTNRYQMSFQRRTTLSYQMFLYALIEYKKKKGGEDKTLPMEKILYAPYSPGRIFQLDEQSINAYAEQINTHTKGSIALDSSAGVYQWVFKIDESDEKSLQDKLFTNMYNDEN